MLEGLAYGVTGWSSFLWRAMNFGSDCNHYVSHSTWFHVRTDMKIVVERVREDRFKFKISSVRVEMTARTSLRQCNTFNKALLEKNSDNVR